LRLGVVILMCAIAGLGYANRYVGRPPKIPAGNPASHVK
jgi:hypothetical protein